MGVVRFSLPLWPKPRIELDFGRHRVYSVGQAAAPFWVTKIGPLKRVLPVLWRRLEGTSEIWWIGQYRQWLVIVGQGVRPALVLRAGGWRGLVPGGFQSVAIELPDRNDYSVYPLMDAPRSWT
ncbi:MAG: hypothetical protein OWQ57_12280 [Sulfobacillus sp.]|nr:hypothetical protein [Sulfobacillus sp.]